MLTAEHVEARIKDGLLVLRKLDARARLDAEQLAQAYLDDAHAHVGRTREELEEAWEAHDAGPRGKLAGGLQKLVEDRCTYDEERGVDPVALRRDLFRRACEARRASGALDREKAIADTAAALGIAADRVEKLLFADRRGENVLTEAPRVSARAIVDAYEMGRTQAVLLKAVKVTCDVTSTSPALVRAFFAKLKFHQLLFTIERKDAQTLRVVVDGPASMFDAGTRYGLKLALIVPALRELEAWRIEADVRWGKQRTAVVYREEDRKETRGQATIGEPAPRAPQRKGTGEQEREREGERESESDDLRRIRVAANDKGWSARVATEVLATGDGKVVVPDLVLEREGKKVYVEVLGFWSRDAVWRRVEMAEQGLGAAIVFCVNARLRVSEEVLGEDAHAALYVYKSKIVGPALLDRVERVAYAAAPCTSSSPEHRAASEKPSRAST